MRLFVRALTFTGLVAGVVLAIWFAFFLSEHYIITPKGEVPDMRLTAEIGDFVGGVIGTVFSFVATAFVALTLLEQGHQNQQNVFVQSYYEMLHVHSKNVEQMSLQKTNGDSYKGREVFPQLIKQYEIIFDNIERYTRFILNGGLNGKAEEETMIAFLSDEGKKMSFSMRLTYGYFFYGSDVFQLHNDSENGIERIIADSISDLCRQNQFFTKGYHVVLSHYYRHMFQMISYVINAKCLSEDERYTYAKQLRAQLDDNEQLLLYYDAMADVGRPWLVSNNRTGRIKKTEQMCPLARFQMIRNIPSYVTIKGIDPSVYFKDEISFYAQKGRPFFEQR